MPRQIVILGAGISGLSCAWYLKKKFGPDVHITLIEKSHRVGGWIQTVQHEGFLFEQGPRSCRSFHTLQLVEELQLQDQVIACDVSAQNRYLYVDQKLRKLPHNLFSLICSPFAKQLIPAIWRDLITPKGGVEDESIYNFSSRRFGVKATEQFFDPFILGIYAGNIHHLSLKACFPKLAQYEQQYGSILKGMLRHREEKPPLTSFMKTMQKSPIFSFKEGMETLTRTLSSRLDVDLRLRCRPISLVPDKEGITVTLSDQSQIAADNVISTLPAFALAGLVEPLSVAAKIPYTTVAVVNIGYKHKVLNTNGFGYLVPSQEKEQILGCVWDSCVFPQQNRDDQETRLTVMIRGTEHSTEKECILAALSAVSKHLNIQSEPQSILVKIAKQAIPQYEVGYYSLLQSIQSQLLSVGRLKLAGSAFNGVSVNDCIIQGKKIANDLLLS